MRILLERTSQSDKQTLGFYFLLNQNDTVVDRWFSLELPDKDNQRRISRIPAGIYTAIVHVSPKFGKCLWLQDVPDRSEILTHAGNFHSQILGCILIGMDLADINGDGYLDVTSSRDAMNELMEYLEELGINEIEIEIVDEP